MILKQLGNINYDQHYFKILKDRGTYKSDKDLTGPTCEE
jgi:hypothetical protein